MSRIVHVQHPAPFRYVARGSRTERFALRRVSTPVELPEADIQEFAPVARIEGQGPSRAEFEVHARGGKLWIHVPALDRDGLVRLLEGEPCLDAAEQVRRQAQAWHFWRTPLLGLAQVATGADDHSLYPYSQRSWGMSWCVSTGRPVPLDQVRRVAEDGEERAAAQAAGFVRERIAVTGRGVFLRTEGPHIRVNGDDLRPELFPWVEENPYYVCRLDRLPDFLVFWEEVAGKRMRPDLAAAMAVIPSDHMEDGDLRHFLNWAPWRALSGINFVVGNTDFTGDHALREALLARAEALRPWVVRAMTGGVMPEDGLEVGPLVRDLLRDTVAAYRYPGSIHHFSSMADYVDDVLLPRLLRPEAMPSEDDAALSELRP